ncbi:MAG: hypothetical protein ACE5PM_07965 [Candidatus Hydrothermarchaeales archaeon]
MKILHILKRKPTESEEEIIDGLSRGNDAKIVELYKGGIDYKELVDLIFEYDKVVCW